MGNAAHCPPYRIRRAVHPHVHGERASTRRPGLLPAVHPHVHGERCWSFARPLLFRGSSPRTWGTPGMWTPDSCHTRFIPTYMGNAPASAGCSRSCPVHPHVHGERTGTCAAFGAGSGSSPRTWGTRRAHRAPGGRGRFIPTYMGNASASPACTRAGTVHPHVHGERIDGGCHPDCQHGSSPRTWGTPRSTARCSTTGRFIPTYMGNAVK